MGRLVVAVVALTIALDTHAAPPDSAAPLAFADLSFGDEEAIANTKLSSLKRGDAGAATATIGGTPFDISLSFFSGGLWRVDLVGPEADWSQGSDIAKFERILSARYGGATHESFLKGPTGLLTKNEAFNPLAAPRMYGCSATSAWLTDEREVVLWGCQREERKPASQELLDDAKRVISGEQIRSCPEWTLLGKPGCEDFNYFWHVEISILSPPLAAAAEREAEEAENRKMREEGGLLP